MPAWQSGAVIRCLHQILPVLWPSEWRVTMTRSGLYLVEADSGDGWRLERMCFRLSDAFALGESLHGGPTPLARLSASGAALPESYRVPSGDDWQGSAFRAALDDNPFSLDTRPEDVFATPGRTRALAAALDALANRRHVVLAGGPGTGKSLLLRELATALASRGVVPTWPGPGEAPVQADVVLVDDAEAWTEHALAGLLRGAVPVVLATGRTELSPAMAAGMPVQVDLLPLSAAEVAQFVADRLRAASRFSTWPEAEAVLALAERSCGVPRDLIMLAGAACFLADLERAPHLLVRHVDHAAAIAAPGGARLGGWALPSGRAGAAPAREWRRPGLRLAVAGAGLAFVVLTSWSARWVGTQAQLAQLDTALTVARAADAPVPMSVPVPVLAAAVPARAAVQPPPPPPPADALAATDPFAEARRLLPPSSNPADVPFVEQLQPASPAPPLDAATEDSLGGSFDAHIAVTRADPAGAGRLRAQRDPSLIPALATPGAALAEAQSALGSFRGPVSNETLRLTGKLALELSRDAGPGAVRARFRAWDGLLGTGLLQGSITADGRVTLSGQLLMGKNPFLCTLTGTIQGDHFSGSAEFVRPWGGRIAHSSFSLLRT